MNDLVNIARKSVAMKNMNSLELLIFLGGVNTCLQKILEDEKTYSYDVYYALMILTHNFRIITNPNYLKDKSEYSYFKKKINSYYRNGGNKEVSSYLIGVDSSLNCDIEETIMQSKKEFVLLSFYKGYSGLPEELKHFCEVPDFYPEITGNLVEAILKKKR